MQKTKAEIINETAAYYHENPRAKSPSGKCMYLTEDGRMCAVGRCMTPEAVAAVRDICEDAAAIDEEYGLERLLKEEYRHHSLYFWSDLQSFHDRNDNWGGDGITLDGQRHVAQLLEDWG